MPPSQLKQRARSEESCVAFRKIFLKSAQQSSTLRTSLRQFPFRNMQRHSARINLPVFKFAVHIERTIGSESAVVRRVWGVCPADPHTISARFHPTSEGVLRARRRPFLISEIVRGNSG